MSEYDLFCIYGFRTVCPVGWKIELDPKSDQREGNVTFKSPEKVNDVVSWGPLEEANERYSSLEEHVKESISRIKEDRKVKKVELVQSKDVQVNSHKAIFSHIRMIFSMRKLSRFGKAKTHEREVRSLHFYCKPSGRYFVVYGITTIDESSLQGRIFKNIMESFVCHKAKANPTNQ